MRLVTVSLILASHSRKQILLTTQPSNPDPSLPASNLTGAPTPSPGPNDLLQNTFLDNFLSQGQFELRMLMAAIPELETLMLIPVWRLNPEGLPRGLIRTRRDSALAVDEEMRLIYQLHSCLMQRTRRLGELLGQFDAAAGDIAKRVAEGTAALEQLRTEQQSLAGTPARPEPDPA